MSDQYYGGGQPPADQPPVYRPAPGYQPGLPPPPPPVYPGAGYQQPYPAAYAGGPGPGVPPSRSSLPTVSLVLGICSIVIFCLGVVLGAAAIIIGIIGRGKAKKTGQGTGAATAGIVTGVVGVLVWFLTLVLALTGSVGFLNGVFGMLQSQYVVAEQLDAASTAANKYRAANGSYAGLTTEQLSAFGYSPSSEVSVTAVPLSGGTSYCVSGHLKSEADNVIHMPADAFGQVTITINGREYKYSLGGCPVES